MNTNHPHAPVYGKPPNKLFLAVSLVLSVHVCLSSLPLLLHLPFQPGFVDYIPFHPIPICMSIGSRLFSPHPFNYLRPRPLPRPRPRACCCCACCCTTGLTLSSSVSTNSASRFRLSGRIHERIVEPRTDNVEYDFGDLPRLFRDVCVGREWKCVCVCVCEQRNHATTKLAVSIHKTLTASLWLSANGNSW